MALKKVYSIEIQMDAARAALTDANKRLEELDASLEGLDRNSDAAKSIVAEMAKAAKQVDSLTREVDGLSSSLDNLQPGTIGALREEAKRLEAALDGALQGSADADKLIAELGKVKAELKDIDEAVDVSFDKDRAGALADAATGVAGAFSLATVAAQNFGLTKDDAEKYNQKLLEMLSVVQSLEQIQKLTTSEVSTALKGLFGDAKRVIGGYFGIGQASTAAGGAASASANVTRLALASLGIGVVLLILGLVVTNWDKITAAVKKNKETIVNALLIISPPIGLLLKLLGAIEKKFGSVSSLASGVAAAFKQIFSNIGDVLSGAEKQGKSVAEAFHAGVAARNAELADERLKTQLRQQLSANEQYLKIIKSKGRDGAELEARIFQQKLYTQKRETAEEKKQYQELLADYTVFRIEQRRKGEAEQQASELATLNARLARAQAAGREEFGLQVDIKQRELSFLLSAPQRNQAAITAKEAEISVIREKARQSLLAKEYEEFKKRVVETETLQLLALGESERRKAEALAKIQDELGQKIQAGTSKVLTQIEAEARERADNLKKGPATLGEQILIGLFGVGASQVDAVRQQISQAVANIGADLSQAAAGLLSQASAEADARLSEVQQRLSLLDQQLASRTAAADDTEAKLATATGARRDFLILKLQKERSEEEKTRAARAKAAKEEQQALRERHKLEVAGQKIAAASTLAASAYNSVLAIQAALEAVKSGSKLPFPLNIAAVVAALAAVTATVVSARGLGQTVKLADGGVIEGGSHASGNDVPVFGGKYRVEGGEMITPVDATARNRRALELIRTIGRTRTLLPADFARAHQVRVLPAPKTRFADGGILPSGQATPPSGGAEQVLVQQADLAELLAYARATAANTATVASYGPPRLAIGPPEALAIGVQQQAGRQVQSENEL